MTDNFWLLEFAEHASKTDKFTDKSDHVALLAAGLIGEAGSIVAELKKKRRERDAYPAYREKMVEELGDFLWYFVRLTAVSAPGLLKELSGSNNTLLSAEGGSQLSEHLEFGAAVGEVLAAVSASRRGDLNMLLGRVWGLLMRTANDAGVCLANAAVRNKEKIQSLWPEEKHYLQLFDDVFPMEEQLPRHLQVDFFERASGSHRTVILRCNEINFGDRLTDNIGDPDGYRFHDIFHFAYVVYLGWSPVVRALMRSKRKSDAKVDEVQDGARARIIEEAVSAIIFSRAKQLNFFEGLDRVDLELLNTVKEFVAGFEVEIAPLWQWETAILNGYRVFRALCAGSGGRVTLDMGSRQLIYQPLSVGSDRAM